MTTRLKKMLANLNGLGERTRSIFQRSKQQIPQRMVIRKRETILERLRERIFGVRRECRQALTNIARRRHARLFAQLTGGAAVIGHGYHGVYLAVQAQKAANRHGGARAAAHYNGALARKRVASRWLAFVFRMRQRLELGR